MHTDTSLTEAARRVVEIAQLLAEQEKREYDGCHLLKALWLDESRGQEWLSESGVTAEDLPAAPLMEGGACGDPILQAHIRHARRLAEVRGRQGEIGTEHLLLALLFHDERISAWAATRGIRVAELRARLHGTESKTPGAIDTDVRLQTTNVTGSEGMLTDRLIDAVANRTREALRVMEDIGRFILNDAVLSEELKKLRHGLQQVLHRFHQGHVILARDTPGDVGTSITLPTEMTRGSVLSLVRSNAARAQEGLRSLEEVTKLQDAELAVRLKQLRYRVYNIEAVFARRFIVSQRIHEARLCLLVTDAQCRQPIGQVVREACASGVDMVQLREKSMPDKRLREVAGYVREWTAEAGVVFVVNDRPDIAALVGADGVHVGQDDLSIAEVRRIVGGDKIVGVSTHNVDQLQEAVLAGADYLGVGPVFSSTTKSFEELAGLEFVREAVGRTSLPWFGIGGITAENVKQILEAGGRQVAVSAAICQSGNALEATQALRRAIDEVPNQPFASSSVRTAP